MKVRIAFTIEIDAEAWALDNGMEASEVREDVQGWAEYLVTETLRERGMLPKSDAEVYEEWIAQGAFADIPASKRDAIVRHLAAIA